MTLRSCGLLTVVAVTTAFVAAAPGALASPPVIRWLDGIQPREQGQASAVSPDGRWIVGSVGRNLDFRALRWRPDGSLAPFDNPPPVISMHAVSNSGAAVGDEDVLISPEGSTSSLSAPFGEVQNIWRVSADGRTYAGNIRLISGTVRAARWVDGAPSFIGALPGATDSIVRAMSSDGRVLAGVSGDPDDPLHREVFVWREGEGMTLIPTPTFSHFHGEARGVSMDGSVIAGQLNNDPAIWREGIGWTMFPSITRGVAEHVSADGSVVIGQGTDQPSGGLRPFIWTESGGMRFLSDYLESELGMDLTNIGIDRITGISDDGLTMVGAGYRDGMLVPLVIVIPSPGPAAVLAIAGFFGLAQQRRRTGGLANAA